MKSNTFDVIILIGRPASGKSEIIDFLKNTKRVERIKQFRIAQVDVLDDFPMLWAWFEEDHILSESFCKPRLHTDDRGYFKYDYLWDLLIERLDLEYGKRLRGDPNHHSRFTTIVEFSRGSEHGGYARAFDHLSDTILSRAGIVYVDVPYEESLRKNRRRSNPEKPDSILEHSLANEKLERLYRYDDWRDLCGSNPSFLILQKYRVPYVVFENSDDVTTGKPLLLVERLQNVLGRLWELKQAYKSE
jgi:hypothetical protein